MEVLKRTATLTAVLLLGACDLLREPTPLELTDEQIMVHGVLQSGTDTVTVLLTRVRPQPNAAPGTPSISVLPVSGADVRITGGGSTVQLVEAPADFAPCVQLYEFAENGRPRTFGPGCYAAVLPSAVRPGVEYSLNAQVSGGEIRGTATIPALPTILAPESGARLRIQDRIGSDLQVRWNVPLGVAGVGLSVRADAAYRGGTRVPNAECSIRLLHPDRSGFDVVLDASRTDPVRLDVYVECQERTSPTNARLLEPDSVHARLLVTAYDSAYTQHAQALEGGGSVQRSRFAAGVTGALGVFAGAAPAERRITLVQRR